MRDPVRIQRILNKLHAAWSASPDLRFNQLVKCINSGIIRDDYFYFEDDDFEQVLDKWLKEHNISISGGWKS